jgi:hypothetical protein
MFRKFMASGFNTVVDGINQVSANTADVFIGLWAFSLLSLGQY